ncbi:MAG: RAD55 family ATPase [Ktedonobacterales bacterium]
MSAKQPDEPNETVQVFTPLLDPTGVPNLDQVVGGGIPRGSLVIIVGPPGSGKTTLANQMAFAAARNGRRSIVLTALSEPTSKLIAHLSSFSFYDDELVGDEIQFLSLQQFLNGGLEATGDEMVAAARRGHAGFVVLDGFRGVRGADVDPQSARQFLYDIGTTLSVLGTTTVITSEADPRDPVFFPEATTGDVILGLHYDLVGVRQWRGIEAIKVRGGAPLSGVHGLALGEDGATIYPRIESRVAAAAHGTRVGELAQSDTADDLLQARGELDGRAQFDIPDLDALLGGGLTRGTSTLLVGSLGTGKTLLGLHFAVAGARADEPTLFLGFRESQRQLLLKAEPFAMEADLRAAAASTGALTLMRWSPVELNPDILAEQLLITLDKIKARRLVVDSAAELERAINDGGDPRRVDNYLAALVEALRMRGITALFTREIPQTSAPELSFATNPISVMAENVLLLRQIERDNRLTRLLSVIKMRFSAHDVSTVREFVVAPPKGISLMSPSENGGRTQKGVDVSDVGERDTLGTDLAETRAQERLQRRSSRDGRTAGDRIEHANSDDTPEGTP